MLSVAKDKPVKPPKDDDDWGTSAALFGLGALTGLAGSSAFRQVMNARQARIAEINEVKDRFHVKEIAGLLLSFSAFLPGGKWKFALAGAGAGMTAEELVAAMWKKAGLHPMTAGDLNDIPMITRFSKVVSFPATLSVREKEKIILPLFANIIDEQRENPLQDRAIAEYQAETGTSRDRWTLEDSLLFQKWLLYWGTYTANEGLWWGHDRWRTLAKLMRDRRQGFTRKDGHNSFMNDCDDCDLSHNQIVDSYGYPTYHVLISQKPQYQGTYPLHHVLPAVVSGGQMFLCEMIKPYPFVPLEQASYLFANLNRLVLVYPDGTWEEPLKR